jgi:hypothetical protein
MMPAASPSSARPSPPGGRPGSGRRPARQKRPKAIGDPRTLGAVPIFGERQRAVAIAALVMVGLEILASVMFLAVYDFDIRALAADPGALPLRGPEVATLLRLGGLVDMLGYLALAPLVVYLDGRLRRAVSGQGRDQWLVGLLTFGGLSFSLVGSIGAVLFASVGPPLLEATSAGSETATAAKVAFAVLGNGVNIGLWGTLEWLSLGTWLIGVGWLVRAEGRAFGWLGVVTGIGAFVYAARSGLSGHPPADFTSPLDLVTFAIFGLFFVWVIWLAARLWKGAQELSPAGS